MTSGGLIRHAGERRERGDAGTRAGIEAAAGARGTDGGSADTLPLQPRPLNYQVHRRGRGEATITTIARVWRLEDARRCRLCARCTASVGDLGRTALCLKVHHGPVADHDAALFAERGAPGDPRRPAVDDVGGMAVRPH